MGTVDAGMLAGLAHPRLHVSLVAMHDDPGKNWKAADLASIAQMSRSQFISTFPKTVGQSPIAYLNAWRLSLGRAELGAGRSVKSVAAIVGFGSAAAFSRAYSRKFGSCPSSSKRRPKVVPGCKLTRLRRRKASCST
jgi:transcriptional regulator GlxA family with amidase domain